MGDIQQWRRKIQPARGQTLEPDDWDELSTQKMHKQRLKRKVSSYFDFGGLAPKVPSVQDEVFTSHLPQGSAELLSGPKTEDEIDSVMRVLMAEPYKALDVRFNCSLMRIFERFFQLKEEIIMLQGNLNHETMATRGAISQYNMALKDWQDEKEDYREEVKRLEILLSKTSKRSLAEVTLARQDSKIRQRKARKEDKKETIFEFLERSKTHDDRFYNSQRATMKPLLRSPSYKDKTMSRKLSPKKSFVNVHADLPFGTLSGTEARPSPFKASLLVRMNGERNCPRVNMVSSASDSTFSSFSCDVQQRNKGMPRSKAPEVEYLLSIMHDRSKIERLANALAEHRGLDLTSILPKLFEVFGMQPIEFSKICNVRPAVAMNGTMQTKSTASTGVGSEGVVMRHTVISKASGFFHRLMPQSGIDGGTADHRGGVRRLSFEHGDDKEVLSEHLVPSAGDSILCKSASVDALKQKKAPVEMRSPLSPVAVSPANSVVPTGGRLSTRIPTPVYPLNWLAKPRQQREDSASSLLTAIRHADDAGQRKTSASSSSVSSTPVSRVGQNRPPQANGIDQGSSSASVSDGSNRQTCGGGNFHRGDLISATPRATSTPSRVGDNDSNCRPQSVHENNGSPLLKMEELRQQNMQPLRLPGHRA